MRTLAVLSAIVLAPALLVPPSMQRVSRGEAAQVQTTTTVASTPPETYLVGAQDQLSITVFEEPELTGKYRVENDGYFTFPLLDRVRAAGQTLAELQASLTTMLSNGFLRSPQVRVEVDQYKSQSVFVSGEVRTPGKILMTGRSMTLLEALALAGSPTAAASNVITVARRSDPTSADGAEPTTIRVNRRDLEVGRTGQDLVLRDGDIVNVPPAQRFYIAGHVRSPGFYVLEPGMTVQQAIALSGGLTDRGSDRGITATRLINGKAVDVSVRLEDVVVANDTLNIRQRFF
jgi:polysaccharide biosynthesis/export protein